jgi:hypothetical protein
MVLVSRAVLHAVQFLGFHDSIPLAWLRIHGVAIGFLYARHSLLVRASGSSSQADSMHKQAQFLAKLHSDVAAQQSAGRSVVLVGDMNARIGALEDGHDSPRIPDCQPHNQFGSLLMAWAQEASFMTLTGRLDTCQHTWQRGAQRSRIDHAFIQPDLLHQITSWQVMDDFLGSDHKPLCMTLTVPCTDTRTAPVPRLRWNPHRRDDYAHYIGAHADILDNIMSCMETLDAEGAYSMLTQLIHDAGNACGLLRTPTPCGRPDALPLCPQAVLVRNEIRSLRKASMPVPDDLRRAWRTHIKVARHTASTRLRERMRQHLLEHPRIFWSSMKRWGLQSCAAGILPTSTWGSFFAAKFGNAQHRDDVPSPTPIPTNPACPLMRPVSPAEVVLAFTRLGTAKATGADNIPAEFFTKAASPDTGPLFAAVIARMCNVAVHSGHIPACWKEKLISPVFKSGARTDPANYRPIAVATTMYRILTAIFSVRLSAYAPQLPPAHQLLDCQFGFRPALSIDHAHFVLTTCCNAALARGQQLALVKLDISKAYDTVDRPLLWESLRRDGFPPAFIQLMQELYRDTPYMVKVNGERSHPFYTDTGVLQGCALSPALYNHYLRECLLEVEQRCKHMGIALHDSNMSCVQVDYADDIHGTVAVEHVEAFINIVQEVLARKCQHLNLAKCKVLIIARQPPTHSHIAGMPVVRQHRILGLLYTHNGCTTPNLDERKGKGAAKAAMHISRLHHFGCKHDAHIASVMLKQDVQPTLMFGSSIWGHYGLSWPNPMKHPLQAPYSILQRTTLYLPHCTAHWTSTLLFGTMPIQHWIVRDFCRFWNRMVACAPHNSLIAECLRLQIQLMMRGKTCWLRRWYMRLIPVLDECYIRPPLLNSQPLDEHTIMSQLTTVYTDLLSNMGDPWDLGDVHHRKTALAWLLLQPHHRWGSPAAHIHIDVPPHVRATWLHLLGGNAPVPARQYEFLRSCPDYHLRICTKCSLQEIAHEPHVLLRCQATLQCRRIFAGHIRWRNDLLQFVQDNRHKWSDLADFIYRALTAYQSAPDCR